MTSTAYKQQRLGAPWKMTAYHVDIVYVNGVWHGSNYRPMHIISTNKLAVSAKALTINCLYRCSELYRPILVNKSNNQPICIGVFFIIKFFGYFKKQKKKKTIVFHDKPTKTHPNAF